MTPKIGDRVRVNSAFAGQWWNVGRVGEIVGLDRGCSAPLWELRCEGTRVPVWAYDVEPLASPGDPDGEARQGRSWRGDYG